eukprot:3231632-Pyramimonas_sp.AAC.1
MVVTACAGGAVKMWLRPAVWSQLMQQAAGGHQPRNSSGHNSMSVPKRPNLLLRSCPVTLLPPRHPESGSGSSTTFTQVVCVRRQGLTSANENDALGILIPPPDDVLSINK